MKSRYIFILNEINVLYLLFLVLLRREVYIYSVRALFPPFNRILIKVSELILQKRLANLPEKIPNSGEWLAGIPMVGEESIFRSNIYPRVASSFFTEYLEKYEEDEYEYAYKKIFSQHLFEVMKDFFLVRWMREEVSVGSNIVIVGSYPELIRLECIYYKEGDCNAFQKYWSNGVANVITYFLACFYIVIWVLKRITLKVNKKHYQFAVDTHMAWLDQVYKRLPDQGENLIYFHRGRIVNQDRKNQLSEFDHCSLSSVNVSFATAIQATQLVVKDGAKFLYQFWMHDGKLFYSLMSSLVARGMYRGFFKWVKIDFFFMLDDYNPDHVVRNLELRRAGGVALSSNHGMPTSAFASVPWIFVDADYYFSYGVRLYNKFYKKYWSKKVKCVPVGSLVINPDQIKRSKIDRFNNDILVLLNPSNDLDLFLRGVVLLAEVFRDRQILLWPKPSRVQDGTFNRVNMAILGSAPDNLKLLVSKKDKTLFSQEQWVQLVDTKGQRYVYELMLRCRYAVATWSTTVVEAIQLRCITFFMDRYKSVKDIYYRDFPQMCVDDFEQVISKITSIESGDEEYKFDSFDSLVISDITDPVVVMKSVLNLEVLE